MFSQNLELLDSSEHNGTVATARYIRRRGPSLVKISATLITLNEEENLPRALDSLSWCDEIVVLDSGSSDRTVEIAEQFGARVLQRDFDGYADQKNFADHAAGHDWILSLDADEALSESLAKEIREIKRTGPGYDGYRFPRKAQYLGKWIHHSGWYPDPKVRFYDRRKARWVGLVHESVSVDGTVGELSGDLLHYTCRSLTEHLHTVDRYTTLAAREMISQGKRAHLGNVLISPPWAFLRTYILKLGFLDGFEGLVIAAMASFYVFRKYVKAMELSSR